MWAMFIERVQNFVLLRGRQSGEFGDARKHFGHSGLHLRQAFAIGSLVVDAESRQATINEVNNSGLARTRTAVVARNNAGSNGVDFFGFLWAEEFELGRRSRFSGLACVCRGSHKGRQIRGNPYGRKASDPSRQELTAADRVIHFEAPLK